MAIAILNPRHKDLRGVIGNLVVKHYGDKVVITRKPVFTNRTFSEAQKSCQDLFRQAAVFANKLMADPRARRVYQEEARLKRKPARSLMIADFLRSVGKGVDTHGAGVSRTLSTQEMVQSQRSMNPASSSVRWEIRLGSKHSILSMTPTLYCVTAPTRGVTKKITPWRFCLRDSATLHRLAWSLVSQVNNHKAIQRPGRLEMHPQVESIIDVDLEM